jgi:hypothetical protein
VNRSTTENAARYEWMAWWEAHLAFVDGQSLFPQHKPFFLEDPVANAITIFLHVNRPTAYHRVVGIFWTAIWRTTDA